MPIRFAVTKQSSLGEQIVADVCQWNPVTGDIVHSTVGQMKGLMEEALTLVDDRAAQMHQRMLAAYNMKQYCTGEEWMKFSAMLDVITGKMDPEFLVQRWEAIKEENAALQHGRDLAYHNGSSIEVA